MLQYPVPLFIETESPIFGPLNILQFIIIGIAGAIAIFVLASTKSLLITFVVMIVIGTPAFYLAFGRINGEKVPKIIALGVKFSISSKIALWQKRGEEGLTLKEIQRIIKKKEKTTKRNFQESKLKKIAWKIQTGGK